MNRVSTRDVMERGRQRERRRVLSALDRFAWMAATSPNGEIAEAILAALRAEIEGTRQ